MGRKFYDDFAREPLDKMAQSIVDMTYGYQSTIVPKKHYKAILEKDIIELASQDTNIELALLRPYYDMISSMNKENRKYFVKALLMHELKLKYNSFFFCMMNFFSTSRYFLSRNYDIINMK